MMLQSSAAQEDIREYLPLSVEGQGRGLHCSTYYVTTR
jgi:hypothetical protein